MGKHLKRLSNKFTGKFQTDNSDIKELESLCPTILSEQDRLALKMLAEGSSIKEISRFLEISEVEVSNILAKPQVDGIMREYYDKVLKFKLAPQALKVMGEVLKQTKHTPARLAAADKILTAVNVMKKDSGDGRAPNVGVFVNTTVSGGDGSEGPVTREQIAVIRQNLEERRTQIYERSTNTGSGSSNRDGPDK